ncbi:MAG: UDP-N-acetylmuramoyl-L-alanine--D-glutamate ligase [Planctomycetes bacterium]|nr:UDP-N-acetylmuramoyl-L-alanine--D-glutamate ligase [Planctomycetota bacterium]
MTHPVSTPFPLFCSKQKLNRIVSNVSGKIVTVIGLGLFGGGEGAVRFFANRGAEVTVTDQKTADQLSPVLKRIEELELRFVLGRHDLDDLVRSDLIVVNPAVPRRSKLLRQCHDAGVPMTTPMNIFLAACPAPITAVTGSVGKSTTTAMLAKMLKESGYSVHLGGNMGISLLPELEQIKSDHFVVLELSSVQVEDAGHMDWSPRLGIITNLTPNHLDRYHSFEAYANAKKHILTHQSPHDAAFLNHCDPTLLQWTDEDLPGKIMFFAPDGSNTNPIEGVSIHSNRLLWKKDSERQVICTTDQISVPGKHNIANAMAATGAAIWLGCSVSTIRTALSQFSTLEHRLEQCEIFDGITFYNDSDATIPQSTVGAIETFERPITLIAGGYNKNLDIEPLAEAIARRVEVLVTLGESGPQIAQLTREAALHMGHSPLIEETSSLKESIEAAFRLSMPGSTVLFSPACASFDMFENFAERGQQFKKLVREVANERGLADAECA